MYQLHTQKNRGGRGGKRVSQIEMAERKGEARETGIQQKKTIGVPFAAGLDLKPFDEAAFLRHCFEPMSIVTIQTKPYADQKPGTSGLRKKVSLQL